MQYLSAARINHSLSTKETGNISGKLNIFTITPVWARVSVMEDQNSIKTCFPIASPQMGNLPTCYGLVSDTANYANEIDRGVLATSVLCHWLVVREFGKQQDATYATDFCPRQLVMDLLRGSCGETGIMDIGKTCYGEVANLLRTRHGGNWCNGFWFLASSMLSNYSHVPNNVTSITKSNRRHAGRSKDVLL